MSNIGNKKSIPINMKDLDLFRKDAKSIMTSCNYAPGAGSYNKIDTLFANGASKFRASGIESQENFSIGQTLSAYRDKFLPNAITSSPKMALSSYVIQEALALGGYMNDLMKRTLNIDGDNAAQQPNYDDKRMSAAAIGLFSMTSYALYLLRTEPKNVEEINFLKEFGGIPEIQIDTYTKSSRAGMYYLYKYLDKKDFINSEAELLGFLKVYFTELQKLAAEKDAILEADEIFKKNIYTLDGTSFEIRGWEIDNELSLATAVFDEQKLEDIVGNARLKNILRRLILFLLAYDFEVAKNPFFEFGGGFSTVVFLHGKPGTGKTMFYRALATLLRKYCEKHGIPYQILDFPKDMVDSYQGKSAQKAREWFKQYNNPKLITLGGMDDCENVLVNRSGKNASEGTNGIVAVVLTETEGLQKQNKGRALLLGLTNQIGIIDSAVISRMGMTEEVKGPETPEDFMDQTYLWMKGLSSFGEKVDLKLPSEYTLMSRQSETEIKSYKSVEQIITDPELKALYETVSSKNNGYDWFGYISAGFQKRFPSFAGRDVRNIHSATVLRLLDFEIPDSWLEDASVFLSKNYDTKVSMIKEKIEAVLIRSDFEQIFQEETMHYMQNYIAVKGDESKKRVEAIAQEMKDNIKARSIITEDQKVEAS